MSAARYRTASPEDKRAILATLDIPAEATPSALQVGTLGVLVALERYTGGEDFADAVVRAVREELKLWLEAVPKLGKSVARVDGARPR